MSNFRWITALITLMISSFSWGDTVVNPFIVNYGGRLVGNDNKPVSSATVDLKFHFYNAATGGTSLKDLTATAVPLTAGVFSRDLEFSAADVKLIFTQTTQVWIEVEDTTNTKTYPRQRFSAVPYALKVPVDGTSVTYNDNGQLQLSSAAQSASAPPVCESASVNGDAPQANQNEYTWNGNRFSKRYLEYASAKAWKCKLDAFSIENNRRFTNAVIPFNDVLFPLCGDSNGCVITLTRRAADKRVSKNEFHFFVNQDGAFSISYTSVNSENVANPLFTGTLGSASRVDLSILPGLVNTSIFDCYALTVPLSALNAGTVSKTEKNIYLTNWGTTAATPGTEGTISCGLHIRD